MSAFIKKDAFMRSPLELASVPSDQWDGEIAAMQNYLTSHALPFHAVQPGDHVRFVFFSSRTHETDEAMDEDAVVSSNDGQTINVVPASNICVGGIADTEGHGRAVSFVEAYVTALLPIKR